MTQTWLYKELIIPKYLMFTKANGSWGLKYSGLKVAHCLDLAPTENQGWQIEQ